MLDVKRKIDHCNCCFNIVHALYLFFTKQKGCQGIRLVRYLIYTLLPNYLVNWQSHYQPVNPSHVTLNGLVHCVTHHTPVEQ